MSCAGGWMIKGRHCCYHDINMFDSTLKAWTASNLELIDLIEERVGLPFKMKSGLQGWNLFVLFIILSQMLSSSQCKIY